MALIQRLELRQGQSLVMTPQLQQAIKLLQMSNLDLQSFVEEELERNPLLEREERSESAAPEPRSSAGESDAPATDEERPAAAGTPDSGWSSMRSSGGVQLDAEGRDFAESLARPETLAEHLTAQLGMGLTDPADRLVGQHLIGMVNEAGYLTADLASVAAMLGTDMAHVERILAVLQAFDPPGVCARDLRECLMLQLRERDRFDPAMERLIDNLALVARRDFAALKSLCGVTADDLSGMVTELRALNPKPGHAFGAEPVQPVVPDVHVRASPDGTWIVELNNDTLPRVLVNNQYKALVSRTSREEDRAYLSECHANATWLVKSLDQRARTILKVAREIVRQQDAFLALGIQHLRPINLRTVADAIEMHESTVSRVTSNKYMATPRGIFELKYFFTTAIASTDRDGEQHSAESVRHRIREMIAAETAENILSDDAIVEILRNSGIEIARRTVAKYRESLGILSSVQRRRERRAGLARSG